MPAVGSTLTGSAGRIEIFDFGSTVNFNVYCSDPSTNFGSAPWSGFINGVSVGGSFGFGAGAGGVTVASYSVSTTQSVSFSIGDTGTMGIGGPATVSATITRATIPPAPSPYSPDQATQTSLRFRFNATGDGGAPITRSEAQYSKTVNFSTGNGPILATSGTIIFTGLEPGTDYYCRGRCVNAYGNGVWSAVMAGRTLDGGLQVGKSGSFVRTPTAVGKGASFVDTQIFIGKGGTFVPLV